MDDNFRCPCPKCDCKSDLYEDSIQYLFDCLDYNQPYNMPTVDSILSWWEIFGFNTNPLNGTKWYYSLNGTKRIRLKCPYCPFAPN